MTIKPHIHRISFKRAEIQSLIYGCNSAISRLLQENESAKKYTIEFNDEWIAEFKKLKARLEYVYAK